MAYFQYRPKFPNTFDHDTEGNVYRVRYNADGYEIVREKLSRRIVWVSSFGGQADFGIRAYKKSLGNRKKRDSSLIEAYKNKAWDNEAMKREIAMTALKAPVEIEKEEKSE